MRYIVSCKGCGSAWAFDIEHADLLVQKTMYGTFREEPEKCAFRKAREKCQTCCGGKRQVRSVSGRISTKHLCGAKCLSSKGPTCDCSCGGANHGSNYL